MGNPTEFEARRLADELAYHQKMQKAQELRKRCQDWSEGKPVVQPTVDDLIFLMSLE